MLNSKERAKLRAMASSLDASVMVGINGITENLLEQVKMDFSNKELCKIKVLPASGVSPKECMQKVAEEIHAEPVCTIGNFFVLYKVNNKKNFRHILLND
jgi:RNA-binding protein